MNLITKNYNGIAIDFNTEESIYINATQIAKHFNKVIKDWKESKHTIEYIKALIENIKENNPVRGISENGGIFDVFHEAAKEKLIIINQGE